MNNKVTASYFLTDFLNKNDIKLGEVLILEFIYRWIFSSNHPETIIHNDKLYFYICMNYVADNFSIVSRQSISSYFRHWKEMGLIADTCDKTFRFDYIAVQKHFICFDFEKIKESLAPKELLPVDFNNDWLERIDELINVVKSYNNSEDKKDMDNRLFDIPEKQKKYTGKSGLNYYNDRNKTAKNYNYRIEAYSIAVKLIKTDNDSSREDKNKLYKMFAKHKYEDFTEKYKNQTDTFNDICQNIQNIYNGTFLRPVEKYNKKFLNTAQLPVDYDKTKKILGEATGDWNKIRKLILNAYENFCLMHLENYCPCDKHFLRTTMKDWFECNDNSDDYQSQFIQCLFEIPLTKKFYSEKKADNIFGKLNRKSQDYGEELIDLNPSMNSGTAWENIKKMVEWAKLLLIAEQNAKYWIESPSEIIKKFIEWVKNNNIQINTNSFNINWCVENNGPWVWFIQNISKEYKFNSQLVSLVDEADFLDCYKPVSTISFDDMKEVIF